MALIQATLEQLNSALLATIAQAQDEHPTTGALFQLMYNTGLRVGEVLGVERWQDIDSDYFEVQLSKGETAREIAISLVPAQLIEYYHTKTPFDLQTYSSVNNTFKRNGPGLIFGSDSRRTTCHAFRYRFMKQLAAEGRTMAEIAVTMGHINFANTAAYIQSEIWLGS